MGQSACLFCGGFGKLTREHFFPRWLKAALNTGSAAIVARTTSQGVTKTWMTEPFSETVRVVCASCNNGWMADLEAEVQRFLTPMLHGATQRLGRPRQTVLSAWSTKTAMMISQMDPTAEIFPQREYKFLKGEKRPSAATAVLLSRHRPPVDDKGMGIAISMGRSIIGQIKDVEGKPITQAAEVQQAGVVMFAIKEFVATIVSHDLPGNMDISFVPPRPGIDVDHHFLQIWPMTRTKPVWPPRRTLDDVGGFSGMAKAWSNTW